MSEKKFDFECIYYANEIINALDDEGVLEKNLILPDKLRYIVLQLAQNNYDEVNDFTLNKDQVIKALEQAHQLSIECVLDEMQKDGLVEYDGIANDGTFTIKLTEEGMKNIPTDLQDAINN